MRKRAQGTGYRAQGAPVNNLRLLCLLVSCVLCLVPISSADEDASSRVCFQDTCYAVDIAADPASREQGLMQRDGLKPGQGMLFLFDSPGRFSFWMKNMKFPIDILWLDSSGQVVYLANKVPPCQDTPCAVYTPDFDATYVLEIPAGDALVHSIGLTSKASLENIFQK